MTNTLKAEAGAERNGLSENPEHAEMEDACSG